MAWGVCLLWLLAHAATLWWVPGRGGLPEWSSLEALFGPRLAVVLRLAFMACLGWLTWDWVRSRLALSGDAGRLWRVGASLTFGFLLVHLWHLASVFHVADPVVSQRLPELNDRLAATLSATQWGVPWLALVYLTGSIAAGILCGVEFWLTAQQRTSSDTWRARRTRRFLSICIGTLVALASLRALLFFATGATLRH
ncbi:MAG: hypothetical protein R3B07_27065 [Polyangiaceae bacterium]